MRKAEYQSKWLENVTKDQNLNEIAEIENTPWNNLRRWFASRVIAPIVKIGYYEPLTGDVVLGPENRGAHTILTSAVSSQTTDFVITSGETWEIVQFGCNNQTQASITNFYYYDGTNQYPLRSATDGSSGTITAPGRMEGPIRITGNGTRAIRSTLVTFAGGNTVRAMMAYRRVA